MGRIFRPKKGLDTTLTLSQRISSFYIRWVLNAEPNPTSYLDNSSSDEETCLDVDEDYSVVEDSLLFDSVSYASGPASTPQGKKRRTSVHFDNQGDSRTPATKPVAQKTTAVPHTPARGQAKTTPVGHPTPGVTTPSQ